MCHGNPHVDRRRYGSLVMWQQCTLSASCPTCPRLSVTSCADSRTQKRACLRRALRRWVLLLNRLRLWCALVIGAHWKARQVPLHLQTLRARAEPSPTPLRVARRAASGLWCTLAPLKSWHGVFPLTQRTIREFGEFGSSKTGCCSVLTALRGCR
jgi:hypothetical protein